MRHNHRNMRPHDTDAVSAILRRIPRIDGIPQLTIRLRCLIIAHEYHAMRHNQNSRELP